MSKGKFILRVQAVDAVQWSGHADQHPLVRGMGHSFDTRPEGDTREIGICMTHYGRKQILAGDWIVTQWHGGVDVVPGNQFERLYAPVAA